MKREIPDESVDCIVTSPPYWQMRNYEVDGQIGQEQTLESYLIAILAVTAECKRVLKKTGTMFWNHGDCYGGAIAAPNAPKLADRAEQRILSRPAIGRDKCLVMQNERLVIRMCDEQGWYLRNRLIWHKPSCMPNSSGDRYTNDYEPVYFFAKSKTYFFEMQYEEFSKSYIDDKRPIGVLRQKVNKNSKYRDMGLQYTPIDFWKSKGKGGNPKDRCGEDKEKGRHPRCVLTIPTAALPEAHFASFPERLIIPMIKAGCPEDGIVLDPFMGSGTVALVAQSLGRKWVGIELNPEYIDIAWDRIEREFGLFVRRPAV